MYHIESSVSASNLYIDHLDGTDIALSDTLFLPLDKVGSRGWIYAIPNGT